MVKESKILRKLAMLGKKGSGPAYAYSPNDVLVQISLPLILILAIATRLMMIGQAAMMSEKDEGKVIIDLWKQQFILRIDRVLEDWEKKSGLAAYSDFDRVRWDGNWPADEGFKQLCVRGKALDDMELLKKDLYRDVLNYRPAGDSGEGALVQWILFDPEIDKGAQKPDGLPAECVVDSAKREWAVRRIEERCVRWRAHMADLEWRMVDKTIRALPVDGEIMDKSLAIQMKNLAGALESHGYPLLNSVVMEYRRESVDESK